MYLVTPYWPMGGMFVVSAESPDTRFTKANPSSATLPFSLCLASGSQNVVACYSLEAMQTKLSLYKCCTFASSKAHGRMRKGTVNSVLHRHSVMTVLA